MNIHNVEKSFANMVAAQVQAGLRERAKQEANRILSRVARTPVAVKIAPAPDVPKPKRVRHRGQRRQFAPHGSWLALSPRNPSRVAVTGQLAAAMTVAESALASGGADRATLTKLLVEANPGWSRVTASGCISRLVAGGRLMVVANR